MENHSLDMFEQWELNFHRQMGNTPLPDLKSVFLEEPFPSEEGKQHLFLKFPFLISKQF